MERENDLGICYNKLMPNKGYKQTLEHRKKLSDIKIQNPPNYWLGKSRDDVTKEKIKLTLKRANRINERNANWKGDAVGKGALHQWVARRLGKPSFCEYCKRDDFVPHFYNWANISHDYKRDLSDWIRLCNSCNQRYDFGSISIEHLVKRG